MTTNDRNHEESDGCSKMGYVLMVASGLFNLGVMVGRSHPLPASTTPPAVVTSQALPRNRVVTYEQFPNADRISVHVKAMDKLTFDAYIWGIDHNKDGKVDEMIVLKNKYRGTATIRSVYNELEDYNIAIPEPRTLEHYVSPGFPRENCSIVTEFTEPLTEEKLRQIQYLFDLSRKEDVK